jgi:hypothetical protein
MHDEYDEYDDLVPPERGRTRRDRLIDAMPEKKRRKHRTRRDHVSKPKGFKHNRRQGQEKW